MIEIVFDRPVLVCAVHCPTTGLKETRAKKARQLNTYK